MKGDLKQENGGDGQKTTQAECLGCGMKLSDTGVGVSYVAWKIAGRECFAGSVLPGAGESIICVDEFEVDAGGEGGKVGAVTEHEAHTRHLCSIKR